MIGAESSPPLIRMLAAECEFVGCSFQSASDSPELSAAIVWQHAPLQKPAAVALPSGRIRMKDCIFRRVGVGIESREHGAVVLEIANSLHLGPGPMIRLTHAPAADEPVSIHLAQVTLREADALLDCRSIDPHDTAGEINIEACGCVLAPRAQAALFVVTADAFPEPLLHEVKWTGQGSVVAGQVVFGRWYRRDPEFRRPASGKRLTMPRSRLPVWSGAWSSLQEDSTETLPTARSSTARRRCRTPNPPGPPYEPCRRRSSRRVGQASVASAGPPTT